MRVGGRTCSPNFHSKRQAGAKPTVKPKASVSGFPLRTPCAKRLAANYVLRSIKSKSKSARFSTFSSVITVMDLSAKWILDTYWRISRERVRVAWALKDTRWLAAIRAFSRKTAFTVFSKLISVITRTMCSFRTSSARTSEYRATIRMERLNFRPKCTSVPAQPPGKATSCQRWWISHHDLNTMSRLNTNCTTIQWMTRKPMSSYPFGLSLRIGSLSPKAK